MGTDSYQALHEKGIIGFMDNNRVHSGLTPITARLLTDETMQLNDPHQQEIGPIIDPAIFHQLADYLRLEAFRQLNSVLEQGSLASVNMSLGQADLILHSNLSVPSESADAANYQTVVQAVIKAEAGNSISVETNYLLRHRLFTPPHGRIPDDFWPLLTDLAWLALRFQQSVAEKLEYSFRSRVFFRQGEFVSMLVSPCTFWLLLSMACAKTISESGSFLLLHGGQNPPTLDGLEKLKSVGIAQGLQSQDHWAGLWDQWILREALRQMPPNGPAEILQEIQMLPLCTGKHEDASSISSNLAAPDWFEAAPKWFKEWENKIE